MSALSFLFGYFFSYHPGACTLELIGMSIQHTEQYPKCSAYFWVGDAFGLGKKWCSILIRVPWHCLLNKVYPHTLLCTPSVKTSLHSRHLKVLFPIFFQCLALHLVSFVNSHPSPYRILNRDKQLALCH